MIGVGAKTLTGRRVLAYLLGFFGLIFAVNGVFVYFALSTFNGVHTENAYIKGLNYNAMIEAAEDQAALGWRMETVLTPNERGGVLTVTMRTADGEPVDGLGIDGVFLRPAQDGLDRAVVLQQVGAGRYDAQVELPLRGQWDLRLVAKARDGVTYRSAERVWLK